jgi:hypothetical protein
LLDFNQAEIFSADVFKKTQLPYVMKIRPVETELFRADGETDTTKQTVALPNFTNVYKNAFII